MLLGVVVFVAVVVGCCCFVADAVINEVIAVVDVVGVALAVAVVVVVLRLLLLMCLGSSID